MRDACGAGLAANIEFSYFLTFDEGQGLGPQW